MPKQTVIKTERDGPKQLSNNFLVVHDECVAPWICDDLLVEFDKIPMVEVISEGNSSFMPKEEKYRDQNHKYEHQNRIHANIYPHTTAFEFIIDQVGFALPKGMEFAVVNYMQMIKYLEGSHFPWHMDEADDNDTGTSILMLNDNFVGGDLNVAGHRFMTKQGTVVGFNNSTEVWHCVEPIYKGERYCLAIWYGEPPRIVDEGTGESRFFVEEDITEEENAS